MEEQTPNSKTLNEIDNLKEEESLKKIEAALFISGRFLNTRELVALTDINPILLKQLIEKLVEKYSNEETGLHILKKQDMWKMDVKSEHTDMINRLATGSAEFSKAEQETLAIIAYKHPIKQSVLIKIRGNKAYDHVKHFIKLGLIKSKRLGHTKELTLSQAFYDYFQVKKETEEQ